MAETVNGCYKTELVHARPARPTVSEVEFGTQKRLCWWNAQRLREASDYLTPTEYKGNHYNNRARAKTKLR